MADSDKIITVTPNTSVATTHPEIKLVGKDNSPMYLKVLDDNTLSFEGTEGQVFSIGPTMSSGDIFSVNDISGVQNMVVNADGTIKIIPTGTNPSSNLYVGDLKHCFVYARGTGNNNAANSLVYLNGHKVVDSATRGLMLTIINQTDLSVVSSTNYDTYSGGTTNVNNLATAIGNMTDQQIGILVSEDAWEPSSANGANLWAAARLVGLTKLGHYDGGDGSVRRPYAAIFMGSGDDANAANKFVIERMSDADADAPMASVSAIIVSDGTHASISGAQYQNALWSSDSNHEEPALIVDEDKHVGINTVTPVRPLHVTGDAYVQNGDILLSRGNYYLQDASDGTKRGSFTSDGVWAWENVKIGIGETAPDSNLEITEDTNGEVAVHIHNSYSGTDTTALATLRLTNDMGTDSNFEIKHDAWGGTKFYGNTTHSFTIANGGMFFSEHGSLAMKEKAAAAADTTAYGQLWVKTATPNELYFTTDAGDDIQLTSGTSAAGGGGGGMTSFQLEDGDGTEVTIADGKEVKFVEGTGIEINWTDTSPGSNADPYDMTFTVDVSDFMSNGSNNRVVTATGSDAMNAEANMTFDGSTLTVSGDVVATGTMQGYKTEIKAVSSTTTLADADSGKTIYWTGGTLTLPPTAQAGQQYVVINNTGGSATPALGTSNAIVSGWTAHAAMDDETARTYISPAANKWLYIG